MINSFTCIMHVPTCTVPSLVSQEKASGKDDSKVANAACTELLILWYIAAHVNNKKNTNKYRNWNKSRGGSNKNTKTRVVA